MFDTFGERDMSDYTLNDSNSHIDRMLIADRMGELKEESMTSEQILQKAIEKAVKNGYVPHFNEQVIATPELMERLQGMATYAILGAIYSHDFAKALFGEKYYFISNGIPGIVDTASQRIDGEVWQYHLQQMVVSEDPIRYLEQYI